MRHLFITACLFLFSHFVYSAEYRYTNPVNVATFNTAHAACKDWADIETAKQTSQFTHAVKSVLKNADSTQNNMTYRCTYERRYKSNGTIGPEVWNTVRRTGDSCPADTVLDVEAGECKGDPCGPTLGQFITHRHTAFPASVDAAGFVAPPGSICSATCAYNKQPKNDKSVDGDCHRFTDPANPTGTSCKFFYAGTGKTCDNGSGPPQTPGPASKPPATSNNNTACGPPTTGADGSKTQNCVNTSNYQDPGNIKCTGGEGGLSCTNGSPLPVKNDIKNDITSVDTTNPDGSKSNTTTTTTTKTNCKGTAPCTTTTTTKTDTKGTNADGTPGNGSSTCTGPDCGSTGSGAGDDDGTDEDDQGDDGPVVTPISKPTEQGNFDDANEEWDDKIEEAKSELRERIEEISAEFDTNLSLGAGGGSLYCSDSVVILGRAINFCLSDYADSLNMIAMMVLFICALIALFIVFK